MSAIRFYTTLMTGLIVALATTMTLAYDEMPEQVRIDIMTQYFDSVAFDHAMHTELGADCSTCHHHATGTGTSDPRCLRCHADSTEVASVGCSQCHVVDPFSAEHMNREAADVYQFHIDTPGLKAAYHWNCIGCHQEMDGPTDCQDCHARTPLGDAFYHAEVQATGFAESGH